LNLKELFEVQRDFDRKRGWNRYEKCKTPEEIMNFVQHFVLVMVEELGEVSRARKQVLRDKQKLNVKGLRAEMVDLFVYLMQACMALGMDLEEEYLHKMNESEERFSIPTE
jgi:NTP pyrophosphatase (non-canonical NTP hydrolase)